MVRGLLLFHAVLPTTWKLTHRKGSIEGTMEEDACYQQGHSQTHAYLDGLQSGTSSPGNVAAHRELGSPTSISNENNPPQACPQAHVIQGIYQLRLYDQKTIGCVKLTVQANQDSPSTSGMGCSHCNSEICSLSAVGKMGQLQFLVVMFLLFLYRGIKYNF